MAIDATQRRRNAAQDVIALTDNVMAAAYALAQRAKEIQSAGLTFQDSDFEGQPGLAHIDAAKLNNALFQAGALVEHLEANFIHDVFNAIRPR